MRFSIKWMLAAVTYAAVVCVSVRYAGEAWNHLLSIALFMATAWWLLGAMACGGVRRAGFLGLATFSLLGQVAMYGDAAGAFSPISRGLGALVDEATGDVLRGASGVDEAIQRVFEEDYGEALVEISDVAAFPTEYVATVTTRRPGGGTLKEPIAVPIALLQGAQWSRDAQVAIKLHACLLFSLLGGLLGLWIGKREKEIALSR